MQKTPLTTSPFGLIQEELRDRPWRLLVACIMLNLTNIKQVRPVIDAFFERYPDAQSCAAAEHADVAALIRPLGLHNRRASSIIKLSNAIRGNWKCVDDLPGVGKYAADSHKIFVEGSLDVSPTDSKLIKYVEWAKAL